MPRYDYRCKACRHVTEEVQGYEVRFVPCPSCGASAERLPIYEDQFIMGETVAKGRYAKATRAGNVKDKHGRTRVSLFQEASEEIEYGYQKQEQQVGHELPRPSFYKGGLRRAQAMGAKLRSAP